MFIKMFFNKINVQFEQQKRSRKAICAGLDPPPYFPEMVVMNSRSQMVLGFNRLLTKEIRSRQ
jgi:hypothetical protein